ncbi:hypothetical protein GGI07_005441 [Coemansia sp. Benny D115]|nr:hypothetical protein GGI07_005441 [Coemansia sp. Benny D115]
MTYPDYAFEQSRVKIAQNLGEQLDPRLWADMAMVIVISIIYAFNFLAVLFMLKNRKYPPIRSKGPISMTILFLCSALWFVGDVQVNGHVKLAGSAFTSCLGFGFWVRILMGLCGLCAVFAVRTYSLYLVFKLNMQYKGPGFYIPIASYALSILAFGIVASVLKHEVSVEYIPGLDICNVAKPFKIAMFSYVWLSWGFIALVNWAIRNIKASFNESREMAVACITVLIVLVFQTCMMFIHPHYSLRRDLRIASTVLDHVCTNAIWWGVMAVPIYNCMFNRSKYLNAWVAKLRHDGRQREYHIEPSTSFANMPGAAGAANIGVGNARDSFNYRASDGQGFFYGNDDPAHIHFTDDGEFIVVDSSDGSHKANLQAKTASWQPAGDHKGGDYGIADDRQIL